MIFFLGGGKILKLLEIKGEIFDRYFCQDKRRDFLAKILAPKLSAMMLLFFIFESDITSEVYF